MITAEEKKKFADWIFRQSAYQMALSTIYVDRMTVAPAGGNAYRNTRTAYLSGELFSIETEPEMFALLTRMKDDPDLDEETRRAAFLYWKEVNKETCVPKEMEVEAQKLMDKSYSAWLEAKQKDDYSIFAPYLKQVFAMRKQLIGFRNSSLPFYDQLLDDYEPGMNQAKYDVFFEGVKKRVLPLLQKVKAAPEIDDSFLYGNFPVEKQKEFTRETLLPYLGFDASWGYQNETEHPFTDWICENDCRTTTKYLPDNVVSAIFSTVHEVGHARYEHDIDPRYDGMILSTGVSCGMHESQSRLCENYLARRKSFWKALYPALQAKFPSALGEVSLDAFVRAVNAARPGLLRTEADELTYPVHILIRYELEKAMGSGSLAMEDVEDAWNRLYQKYLGVQAPSAKTGILQDVHWADGSFGYFPTYALGSAFAAQFFRAMQKDLDVDKALAEGHYDQCMDWLKEHVHRYGCRYDADEVVRLACGEAFDPDVYFDYLEEKYTKLYDLKESA